MIILIIIINFDPFFKQAPPPLDIFERISGLAETSIATPWYVYFWDDFLFLQKYFQNLILFRYQIFCNRYFFRYHKFLKPIPILFSIPKFSKTDTNIIKKKSKSFETEKFRNQNAKLCLWCPFYILWWGGEDEGWGVGGCPNLNFCGFPMDTFFYSSIS